MKTLDEVATLVRETITPEQIGDGTAYVGLEHVNAEGVIQPSTVSVGELSSNKFAFTERHILYGKLRPYLRKIARPSTEGICTTEIVPIAPGPSVDRDFLFYYLRQSRLVDFATERCAGANLPRLSPKVLAKFPVPLPPLHEQRRIAAILDKADAIRRKRREAIALTEELLRSTFLEMFGDPVTNPKGWSCSTFGDCLVSAQYGPRFHDEPYTSDGVRIVRITDLDLFGRLDFAAMPRHSLSGETVKKFGLEPGDLIFARTGATVGKSAIIANGAPQCIAGAYFIRLRFGDNIQAPYARGVIASKSIQHFIFAKSRQSAQQNFSGPAIRRLPLPLPPLSLQASYAEARLTILAGVKRQQKALRVATELFNSLVQRAFRGEL